MSQQQEQEQPHLILCYRKKILDLKFYPGQTKIVKLQLDLELNMNELERT